MTTADGGAVDAHYGRAGLGPAILDALRAMGKDVEALTPDDLALVDQFHTRGKEATLELARLAALAGRERVLDIGGGLGGPARTLASELGCTVTVLDITEEYCRVGEDLTRRTGLGDRVSFRHGSALELPFTDGDFDVVWTQHSSMNIADKERLYAEAFRALRPGGRLALHEIMAGPAQPIHFPVPWAPDASISFLRPPEAVRALLAATGFRELVWEDVSARTAGWLQERAAAARAAAPPPIGFHLLLGENAGAALGNVLRNLLEERVRIMEAVFARP